MTIPSDNEVGNLWSPRQRGILGWGAGEGGWPSQEGTGSKGGGEAGAEMISFLKPGNSQWAGEKMRSSPPPPPLSSLGSPTENSRQVLSQLHCWERKGWGWPWGWGGARDLPEPPDGPGRQDSARQRQRHKNVIGPALPTSQHNDFFGEKEKTLRFILQPHTPRLPGERKTNQPKL